MINHKGTVTLETPRLILRKFKQGDAESAFRNFVSDKSVTKYLRWYNINTLADMELFIERWALSYDDTTYYWAIALKETGEIVGSIGMVKKLYYSKLSNIYYCIGRDYWGRGLAAEALDKMLDFLFDSVGFDRDEVMHPSNYLALGRLMEKAGVHLFDEVEFEEEPHKDALVGQRMYTGERIPLFFQPIFADHLWGGQRIHKTFGFSADTNRIAEYWAISGVPGSESVIKNGKYKGMTLNQLFNTKKDLFGNIGGTVFPILVKIIDAEKDLSVQVHPDDAYANCHENGKLGKNECWYILQSDQKEIVYGHTAQTREEFEAKVRNNEWDSLLSKRPVQPGDFVMVESGKVHAIKSGVMLLEIQQTSDVTYRLYDYDRVDDTGKKRELHMEKALDVVQYPDKPVVFTPSIDNINGTPVTTLIQNKYFTVRKFTVEKSLRFDNAYPFMIICVTEGGGRFNGFFVKAGSIFLLTADVDMVVVEGDLTFIEAHV